MNDKERLTLPVLERRRRIPHITYSWLIKPNKRWNATLPEKNTNKLGNNAVNVNEIENIPSPFTHRFAYNIMILFRHDSRSDKDKNARVYEDYGRPQDVFIIVGEHPKRPEQNQGENKDGSQPAHMSEGITVRQM